MDGKHASHRVGVIGCGKISAAYFKAGKLFGNLAYVCCADLNPAAARATADTYGCQALEVEELLRRPDAPVILHLTTPQAHVAINNRALQHGKYVYCEKPLALSMEDARPMLALAQERNLRVGCAPDTFMVNDHIVGCFRHAEIKQMAQPDKAGICGKPRR